MSARPLTAEAVRPVEVPRRRSAPLTALPGGAARPGRRLDAVRAPLQARSRVPFLVLCSAILVGALLGALLLNTSMARGSYEMSRLQREVGQTAQDVQERQTAIRQAESTLADRARSLGMVPAGDPTMFSVATGAVVAAPEGTP